MMPSFESSFVQFPCLIKWDQTQNEKNVANDYFPTPVTFMWSPHV